MNTRQLSRNSNWLAGLLLLACGWSAVSLPAVWGAPPRGKNRQSEKEVASAVPEPNIRLNYFNASWKKVLEDVARASGLTLVADRIPSQSYTRRDRETYDLPEAIKILNQEMERQGFRLVKKGKFLVVNDLQATRPEYPRPTVKRPAKPEKDYKEFQNEEVVPEEGTEEEAEEEEKIVNAAAAAPAKGAKPAPKIKRLAFEQTEETTPKSEEESERKEEPAKKPKLTLRKVKLVNNEAVPLAKNLYEVFKIRAELVDEGPLGLQAFRVFAPGPKGQATKQVAFSVGIDEQAQQLVVEGEAQVVGTVAQLIELLDNGKPGGKVQPVLTQHDPQKIAETLQPGLKQMVQGGKKEKKTPVDRAQAGEEEPLAQTEPGEEGKLRRNGPPPQGANPEKPPLEGLKGDVSVEAMSDLGVLILKGAQRDVDAVMKIIRELEELSKGATPDVHLVTLIYVNSESLSSLLNGVYEKLQASRGRQGQPGVASVPKVTTIPVVRPNAILVLAAEEEMPAVRKLIQELDQPIVPETEYQVFQLQHTTPARVEEMVNKLYPNPTQAQGQQNQGASGLAARIRIHGDVRTNSVIIQARPRDLKELESLIRKIDTQESGSVAQLKIVPLKHASADELAIMLRQAILSVTSANPQSADGAMTQGIQGGGGQRGGAGNQDNGLNDVKSTILQFFATDRGTPFRSGILTDIRINSDTRTNSLVVAAPEQSMALIEALIKNLDRPASAVAEIKVFELARGDATAMARLLLEVFGSTTQNRTQGGQGVQNNAPRPLTIAGSEDAGLPIPLKVSVDVRTNSIIAVGSAQALDVAWSILLKLDQSDVRQRETVVIKLKNSRADAVANAINQFLSSRRDVEQTDPGLVSPFEQIEKEVIVVPELGNNSLLISATPRFFPEIKKVVERLDEAPKQVVIQALLVEVALENLNEFGMELGLQDSILFRRSIITDPTTQLITVPTTTTAQNGVQTTTNNIVSQSAVPGFLFNNQQLGNNTNAQINPGAVGNQGLSSFALGRTDNDLGYGGFVFSASSESVSVLLRALAMNRRVDVLSRPQIRALDNQPATIQVGQEIPRVNGFISNGTTGVASPQIEQTKTGIILVVTPRITPDRTVVMEVAAEKSGLAPGQGIDLVTNPGGGTVRSPVLDITVAQSTVGVRDGQTIVMGGMITKNDEVTERKVPWVGDLPLVGNMFRYDYKRTRRTELLIFLTPRIISTDEDSEMIKEIETRRTHFVESDAEQLHGPILAAPGPIEGEEYDPSLCPLTTAPVVDDPSVPTTQLPNPLPVLPAPPAAQPPPDPAYPVPPPIKKMGGEDYEEPRPIGGEASRQKINKDSKVKRAGFFSRKSETPGKSNTLSNQGE